MFQVSLVLSALQAGNKGTQACITAASAVSGIIADLDTTIMFASAGTLNPENEETFADHRCGDFETTRQIKIYYEMKTCNHIPNVANRLIGFEWYNFDFSCFFHWNMKPAFLFWWITWKDSSAALSFS